MKKIIICLIAIVTFSCGDEPIEYKDKTFRNIAFRESPYADIKGIIELNEEEAKSSFHYRFTYDSIGRIKKIIQKIGENNAVYQPDLNRFFVKSPILEITYPDAQTELRKYVNHDGEDFPTKEGVLYEKHEFDQDGFKKKMTYLNSDMKPVQNDWGIVNYDWSKKDGYILEKRYDSTGKIVAMRPQLNFFNVGLHYDDNGFITKFTNYDENGKLIDTENGMASDHITYNENGNFVTWKTFDANGKNVFNKASNIAQGLNIINQKGQPYITHYQDTIGNLTESAYGYAKFETLYDDWGNVVGWKFYNAKEELLKTDDSLAIAGIAKYDDRRRRVGYYFVDEANKLVNHSRYGFAKINYAYDEKNRLKKESFYDKDENLIFFKPRNAAYIEYEYDTNGNRTMKLFNEKSEPIELPQ
jgi:hypothetical protein